MAIADLMISPCKVYVAAVGTTLPATSLAYGGTWPTGWSALGYTGAPLSVEYNFEKLDYDIQETIAPVGRKKTKESFVAETTLAEINMTQLAVAWGGTSVPVSAGAGVHGSESLKGGDNVSMDVKAYGFEGQTDSGFPLRIIVYKATAATGGKLEFGKTTQTGIPLRIEALADMSKAVGERLYYIERVTAEPTS